jgi:pilus assembly protein Flp/PilA
MNLNDVAMVLRTWLGLAEDEEGQGLVEYGLIVVLISIVCIVALTTVGNTLNNVFNQIAGNL